MQHVGGFEADQCVGGEQQPGVVIEEVEDLHLGAVGEAPEGDVGLPELVGEVSLETDEGGARALVGLGRNQALAGEDAPDGGHSGDFGDPMGAGGGRLVWAPASWPSSIRPWRRRRMVASVSASTWWEHERGRLERGSRAS